MVNEDKQRNLEKNLQNTKHSFIILEGPKEEGFHLHFGLEIFLANTDRHQDTQTHSFIILDGPKEEGFHLHFGLEIFLANTDRHQDTHTHLTIVTYTLHTPNIL